MHSVIVLIILLTVSTLTISQDIRYPSSSTNKPSCVLPSGEKGVCKSILLCPSVLRTFRRTKPVHCEFADDATPVVCCPNNIGLQFLFRDTDFITLQPQGNRNIPQVLNDFKCGQSAIYLEKHAETLSKGVHSPHSHHPHSRRRRYVVGGQESQIGEFPWIALIGKKDEEDMSKEPTWLCDGVLIHPEWVLTAAHCVLIVSTYVIRIGEHNISTSTETPHQDFSAASIIINPKFKLKVNYHDLAMIKLSSPVQITDTVMPICFPWDEDTELVGKKATLAGWGAERFGGSLSNVLRDADVTIFDPSVCDESYSTLRDYDQLWPSKITDSYLICAGGPNGGVDSCQGDSGGPLILKKNDKIELIGIVSKGFGCGIKEFPGIYIMVRAYLDWICEMIIQDSKNPI